MNNNIKRYNLLQKSLNSSGPEDKIKIISDLRNETPFDGVILLLKEILEQESNAAVLEETERFLNDLKHQGLAGELITAIEDTDNDLVKQKLISSCWQSGLDYSAYLKHFIRYSTELSYLATLECYSVIEQWIHKAAYEEKNSWKTQLESSLKGMKTAKKKLIEAIIGLL